MDWMFWLGLFKACFLFVLSITFFYCLQTTYKILFYLSTLHQFTANDTSVCGIKETLSGPGQMKPNWFIFMH